MVKRSPLKSMKKLAYGAFVAGALLLPGCEKSPTEVETNYECVPTLEVTPNSGVSPLEIRVQAGAKDKNGQQDIVFYEFKDGTRTINNPVDETFTYTENTVLSSSCKDGDMEKARTILQEITVLQPGIAQSANVDGVNINYDLNTENLEEVYREVLRMYDGDTSTVLRDTITASSYTETFKDMKKGNYQFIVTGRSVADTVNAHISNFIPTTDLSGLELALNEGDSLTVSLPQPSDQNPEDNPSYTSVTSLDGKVNPSLNGNELKIKSSDEIIGNYGLRIWFGNEETGKDSVDVQGEIHNLLDVSGRLEDNITNTRTHGKLNAYEGIISDSSFLGQIQTNTKGDFSFRVNKPLQDSLILRARLDTGINPDSNFIRSIIIPNSDTSGVLIRAHSYTPNLSDNGIKRDDFISHLFELNRYFRKPDPSLINIEIVDEDPLGRGSFSVEEQNTIENILEQEGGSSCYVEGRQFNIQKDTMGSEEHYWIEDNQYIRPNTGWVVITRDTVMEDYGFTYPMDLNEDGFVDAGKILLKNISDFLVNHELGHVYLGGHAETLGSPLSIMPASGPYESYQPGPADCEAAHIFNEETYPVRGKEDGPFESAWYPYENLLGTGTFTAGSGETFLIDKLNPNGQ